MLPGIGGGEIVVIGVVALLVVGPKDLPKLLRQLGRFVGRMRAMADDFKTSFEDMARQSELDDLRKEVEALRSSQALPGISDIKSEMTSIESDIHRSLNAPATMPVDVQPLDTPIDPPLDPSLADPQPKESPQDITERVMAAKARNSRRPPVPAAEETVPDPQLEGLPPRGTPDEIVANQSKQPLIGRHSNMTSSSSDEAAPAKPKRRSRAKKADENTDSAS